MVKAPDRRPPRLAAVPKLISLRPRRPITASEALARLLYPDMDLQRNVDPLVLGRRAPEVPPPPIEEVIPEGVLDMLGGAIAGIEEEEEEDARELLDIHIEIPAVQAPPIVQAPPVIPHWVPTNPQAPPFGQ